MDLQVEQRVVAANGSFTSSDVPALQSSVGNRAITRLIEANPTAVPFTPGNSVQRATAIQRDAVEEKLSAEEEAADREQSEKASEKNKQWIHDKYWGIHLRIAKAEALNHSTKRQKWLRRLEAESIELKKILEKVEPVGMWEAVPLNDRLDKLIKEVNVENKEALKVWENQNNRYAEKRTKLVDQGDYESELALPILDREFDESEKRIDAVIKSNSDALTEDDIGSLIYVLDNETYLTSARRIIEREEQELQAQLDALSEVQEEGPGFLSTVWSVIGCESVGECLGDVALTVGTAGAGKAAKLAIKGVKAAKKVKKARKIIRSAERLGKTLHKALSEAKALKTFTNLVKGSVDEAASTYAKWLKRDWKKIASKISTDLTANFTTGEGQKGGTVAAARLSKEAVARIIKETIREPNPDYIKFAIVVFMKKKYKTAASLVRTFILHSLMYRTAVNVSFESVRATTPLTQSDEILRRTLVSTIAETAQDTVQAIPFIRESGLAKYITESIRKIVQQLFG